MKILALAFAAAAATLLGAGHAQAAPYGYYSERQKGETLVIEHTPAPGIVAVVAKRTRTGLRRAHRRPGLSTLRRHRTEVVHRRRQNPSIAGFCRDGGTFVRPDALGRPVVLQREVCDSVAYYSLHPNDVVARPSKPNLF